MMLAGLSRCGALAPSGIRSSVDHGELGEQILRENRVLEKLARDQQELVFKAVRYHNRKELPSVEDEAFIFFTNLLRDADKLDIYRDIL